ncbi:hypothetical protein OBBRIDRAFT_237963 [Obba rivulosa]|uniref:RRM domain-containing protein n=1 Tax=Obba rivulosa TaxID=1052685 RepID=A0A8E2DQE6_9APHY|nr:hypothetical protein OBBRIDRAFT_237963 [Obba rivulosa]
MTSPIAQTQLTAQNAASSSDIPLATPNMFPDPAAVASGHAAGATSGGTTPTQASPNAPPDTATATDAQNMLSMAPSASSASGQHKAPASGQSTAPTQVQDASQASSFVLAQNLPAKNTPLASVQNTSPPTVPSARTSPSATLPVPSTSVLSVAAPQFQSRLLDAPIDIHGLVSHAGGAPGLGQSLGVAQNGASEGAQPQPQTRVQPPSASHAPIQQMQSAQQAPAAAHAQIQVQQAPGGEEEVRTPNVYINGLPPNFPEEQLLAMTRDFGAVVSVRTFTRHVSDKPSGYGFVLFESVDAAEKCIETLRKYRNLHPSFSKQIHKIPGTPYASAAAPPALTPADSFKARMEQLKDMSSTNLYMEGLPMSIDEPTLSALVRPYRIMSSRFFQTRLSSPPRIIAFVRLETRKAAEEVVERLHGRLVRGWNDVGCRISVRFADTSEQRELRRMERLTREDEHSSPSRLTMAQAALLNLNGTQLHSPLQLPSQLPSPNFGLLQNGLNGSTSISPDLDGLSPLSRAATGLSFQTQQTRAPLLSSSSPRDLAALLEAHTYGDLAANGAQYIRQNLQNVQDELVLQQLQQAQMQFAMRLDSSQVATARAQNGFTPVERLLLQAHVQRQQQEQNQQNQQHAHLLGTQTQLRATSQGQSRVHVRDFATAPAPPSVMPMTGANGGVERREANRRLLDVLPPMSEDAFHATAAGMRHQQTQLQDLAPGAGAIGSGAVRSAFHRDAFEGPNNLARDLERNASLYGQHQRNQTHAAQARADAATQVQALHTRSTTLPSQYLSGRQGSQALNDSSYISSIFGSTSGTSSNHASNSIGTSNINVIGSNSNSNYSTSMNQLASGQRINQYSTSNSSTSISRTNTNSSTSSALARDSSILHSTNTSTNPIMHTNTNNPFGSKNSVGTAHTNSQGAGRAAASSSTGAHAAAQRAEDEDESSPLVSPALTYSARTPATLSPATPFSGFFPHGGETFEGPAMGVAHEGVAERFEAGEKQKTRVVG